MPEWNFIYGLAWRFLDLPGTRARVGVSNLTRSRLYNPHHIAFQLDGTVRLARDWQLAAHCGTAVKGLSGLLLKVNELVLELGVRRAY
jgi:hypothetical protein